MADSLGVKVLERINQHMEIGSGNSLAESPTDSDVLEQLTSFGKLKDNCQHSLYSTFLLLVGCLWANIDEPYDVRVLKGFQNAQLMLEGSEVCSVLLEFFDGVQLAVELA